MQPDAIARVIVGGETIVERGRLTRVDEREIVGKVRGVAGSFGTSLDRVDAGV
jgi:hypothetical protein